MINKTFEQCKADPVNTVYADWEDKEFRCLVLRGPCSLCAYIGVKPEHPLYNKKYSDVYVDCHGGFTFGEMGEKNTPWPVGYYWFGWDYAHLWDAPFYDDRPSEETHWTPDMVVAEFPEAIESLRRIQL